MSQKLSEIGRRGKPLLAVADRQLQGKAAAEDLISKDRFESLVNEAGGDPRTELSCRS